MNMNFPNLAWAIRAKHWPNRKLAAAIDCSEAHISRCMNGHTQFSSEERGLIAQVLGYPERWLFAEPSAPSQIERPDNLCHVQSG
jgi:Helix-turn-helix